MRYYRDQKLSKKLASFIFMFTYFIESMFEDVL